MNYAPLVRRILPSLSALVLLGASAVYGGQRPGADQALAAAESEAAAQHKHIFLAFGASWCPPCHELQAFLEDPAIRPIVGKHFVILTLNVFEQKGKHPELNTPGAEKLVKDYGGEDGGVPFIVFLDAQAQPLINSNRPVQGQSKGENVGYPALPEEIDWFMTMLQKTEPSLTPADAHTIEAWLRKRSHR
jgi:thiol-disulfide isomerase/thioredoxin